MRKVILIGVVVFLLFAMLGGIILYYGASTFVSDCVYYNSRHDRNVILFGEISDREEVDGWIVHTLDVCGSHLGKIIKVSVFTPKGASLFSLGEEIEYEGTQGYTFNKREVTNMPLLVKKNQLFAIVLDEMPSENSIYARFQDFENFDCEQVEVCRSRVAFFNNYGAGQAKFINNLKNKSVFSLLLDFIGGKATVYSKRFGRVESKEHFQELVGSLLI